MNFEQRYDELREAVADMMQAREVLSAAPTSNGRAFNEAMSAHTTALARLNELLGREGSDQ